MLPSTVMQFSTSFPAIFTIPFIIVLLSTLPVIADLNNLSTFISSNVSSVYFCAFFINFDIFNSSCCEFKTS